MFIRYSTVYVDNQEKALEFYTQKLGFVKKQDYPLEESRFITVVSPFEENPTELILEPNIHPACKVFQQAMYEDRVTLNSFQVHNLMETYYSLKEKGVLFKLTPADLDEVLVAVIDDTCGNLIQLYQNVEQNEKTENK